MRTVSAFLRDERGSYTIEFLLWIPVFFFFLAGTIDASFLYLTHTEMWNVARDTARRVTTGQLPTSNDALAHANNTLQLTSGYNIPPPLITADEVTVVIEANIGDVTPFGVFWALDWYGTDFDESMLSRWLHAEVTMRMEPTTAPST